MRPDAFIIAAVDGFTSEDSFSETSRIRLGSIKDSSRSDRKVLWITPTNHLQ